MKEAIERAQQQELERLLYVATTRARHTLVVVLDQEIFATAQGQLPKGAQLRRLIRGADVYRGEFDKRTSTIETDEEPQAIESATKNDLRKSRAAHFSRTKPRRAARIGLYIENHTQRF